MTDTIEIELITYEDIKDVYPFYQHLSLIEKLYKKGKNPQIIHVDVKADSLTNTLAEIGKPTNVAVDFTTGTQIYIRSSSALDTGKSCYVIGQKVGEAFGKTELTTNAANGTTPVDCGLWNFIMYADKKDVCAGNLVIDDDGASTTVYFTLALGASPKLGVIYIPTGFYGARIDGKAWLIAVPSNVNAGDIFEVGDTFGATLNSYHAWFIEQQPLSTHLKLEETQFTVKGYYVGAAETDAKLHFYLVLWEK